LATARGDFNGARAVLEDGLVRLRDVGDLRLQTYALTLLGLNDTEAGDFVVARSGLIEALRLAQDIDFAYGVSSGLISLAALAAAESAPARALRLAAASGWMVEPARAEPELRRSANILAPRKMHPDRGGRWLQETRSVLEAASASRYWAEGRSMSRDAAVAYALGAGGAGPAG
jgi:hypothetical protein